MYSLYISLDNITWTYVHQDFFTIFGQCIHVLYYNAEYSYSPICFFVLRLLRTPKAIDGRRQAKYKNSVVETTLGMV